MALVSSSMTADTPSPPTQSALIVPVPAAEPAVAVWRTELDRAASWGVPAHVTVLYPFLEPQRIDDDVIAELQTITGSITAFDLALERVEWFGDVVVWLAPDPDLPFRALTKAVWDRYPECPPYAGAHSDPIPHLTIGDGGPRERLNAAAEEVRRHLPLRTRVERLSLIAGSDAPGSWHALDEFELGSGGS
jgi:2'-5' RNA ligase superfamily